MRKKYQTPGGKPGAGRSNLITALASCKGKIGDFSRAIKLWCLRWTLTGVSEIGMRSHLWTDRIQARIDALGVRHE